jgi:hypothetical protein
MMFALLLRSAFLVALTATFGLRAAHADIYTWLDDKGGLNVSNIAPPDDAKVLKVVRTGPPASAGDDAGRATTRNAETQLLADRVRQLEAEVEMARSQPPVAYAPPPAPPVVQYFVQPSPPVIQYVVNEAPPAPLMNTWGNYGCDPSWYGCSWGPAFYPYSVVVLPSANFRPFKPGRGGGDFHPRPPRPQPLPQMHTSLIQPLQVPLIQPIVGTQPLGAMPHGAGFRRG